MTGRELNETYGSVIFPGARVSVPSAWMPTIHSALKALSDLPSSIRAFIIVIGLRETCGELFIELAAVPEAMPQGGMTQVDAIVQTARAAVRNGGVH